MTSDIISSAFTSFYRDFRSLSSKLSPVNPVKQVISRSVNAKDIDRAKNEALLGNFAPENDESISYRFIDPIVCSINNIGKRSSDHIKDAFNIFIDSIKSDDKLSALFSSVFNSTGWKNLQEYLDKNISEINNGSKLAKKTIKNLSDIFAKDAQNYFDEFKKVCTALVDSFPRMKSKNGNRYELNNPHLDLLIKNFIAENSEKLKELIDQKNPLSQLWSDFKTAAVSTSVSVLG